MISPGTERAIVKISETLPRVVKQFDELLKMGKEAMSETSDLSVTLTADEWVEVVNAVMGKADRIRKDELPDDEMTQEKLDEWANTLESAYKKITTVLEKNKVVY